MATDSLWQRTQLGFLPRQPTGSSLPAEHPFPQGMASTAPSQLSSQLQFNMGVPLLPEDMSTHFRKPRPIVIEKLEAPKQDSVSTTFISRIPENYPVSVNSSLSSDRLAFAVNLAKRDIKRAKLMPDNGEQVSNDEQPRDKHTPTKDKIKRTKRELDTHVKKETIRQRVHRGLRHHDKELQKAHDMHFYPATQYPSDPDNESHHAKEIRKLRKQLHLHMKQLDDLQQDRPMLLRNRDKRMKRRKENVRLSDDEIDERQIARAEEQAVRSSRMLYTLQRQVRDLQDELNKKGRNIRHTKKSQTLHRLAAAHRAAVRALQTFISQTPLHSKASHHGPDMYQDLAILVRQLSLLTSQVQISTDEKLDDVMIDRSTDQHRHVTGIQNSSAFFKDIDEMSFNMQPTQPSPPTKDREPVAKKTNSPNPSPERDAVLRAGLKALVRAREEALNAEKRKPKVHVSSRPSAALPVKKSLLLPAHLKAKRQRMQPMVQRLNPTDVKHAGFTKDTVSSTLRKVDTEDQPPNSPPRTPTKCPQRGTPIKRHGTPERLCEQVQVTPKSPCRSLEEEFKSPRSPKYQRQMLPEERQMLEREIARYLQVWLDREAELQMQELEVLRRKRHHPGHTSDGAHLARQMIQETEEAIHNRLEPLLDRAEAIMDANKKHDEMKKRSLQHQLTDLTTRTTMEQAHILADEILEDILDDTVLELQRLEVDEEADRVVSGIQNHSTIENVMERLQSFEKGENDIRRHWTRISYDDIDTPSRTDASKSTTHEEQPQHPTPFTFSKDRPESRDNYLGRKVQQHNKRTRLVIDKQRHRREPDDSPRDSDSTASLLEGISTARSSDIMTSNKDPSQGLSVRQPLTRPTIALFVPSELRTSIAKYRSKYERFLRDTATHIQGSFNPWKLADQISEQLLDELIQDVATELGGMSDEYIENIFTKEFIAPADTSHAL
ncbi:hypothetical protein QZH41_020786 [Actinostola sp. cb2023]|nr:hypothetical protein QZH41_020786 [Actinostola sp. cb2023]